MNNDILIEVCAGSLKDCLIADRCQADRIELNSSLSLGGLTPSLGTLIEAKKKVQLPIICMVRPRGGGFCYDNASIITMFTDAKLFLENGADGLAFGFLTSDGQLDKELTGQMIKLCHSYHKEAVFHRAIDCVSDYNDAIECLIELNCDRILTSGGYPKVTDNLELIAETYQKYGQLIEICLGSGITENNIQYIIEQTGVQQLHGSFKAWNQDPTTTTSQLSFAYSREGDYEFVEEERLQQVMNHVKLLK